MTLSLNELAALHNLADKQAGADVDWINIADARALTQLGLARRNRGGWEITPDGLDRVKGGPLAPEGRLAMFPSTHPSHDRQ